MSDTQILTLTDFLLPLGVGAVSNEPRTLADLPAPDDVTCRRLLFLLLPPPKIVSEPLEIEVKR